MQEEFSDNCPRGSNLRLLPWQAKLVVLLIATLNKDMRIEDKVTKGRKGKGYATSYASHTLKQIRWSPSTNYNYANMSLKG